VAGLGGGARLGSRRLQCPTWTRKVRTRTLTLNPPADPAVPCRFGRHTWRKRIGLTSRQESLDAGLDRRRPCRLIITSRTVSAVYEPGQ
jgi:hypothetical protein